MTIFSLPDPLVTGPANLVLMAQNADGATVPVEANGVLRLAGHAPVMVPFRRGNAASPQLPGATVTIPAAGAWQMDVDLVGGGHFAFSMPVAVDHGKRDTVLWAVLFVIAAVALFLGNQQGRRRLAARRV